MDHLLSFCLSLLNKLCYALELRVLFIACVLLAASVSRAIEPSAEQARCAKCHRKQVEGYAQSGMAQSMSLASHAPAGTFTHASSGTRFTIAPVQGGSEQSWEAGGEGGKVTAAYAIGSGNHAVGYLAFIGDHLFQSPVSYYTASERYDVAPGYESAAHPDFSRPVTPECLGCHAGRVHAKPETLNSYERPAADPLAIGCERCHGPAEAHLQKPVPGSIVNPAKLSVVERDSICERCHLAGEIRIPNPGKAFSDFVPGQRLEDTYSVYVRHTPLNAGLRVISHSEQLRLSLCARSSAGKLWCGTCHNPHEKPVNPVAYYREKCLACHAAALPATHGEPGRNCIGCHMPRQPAKDGGHTAFTNHRIARAPIPDSLGDARWSLEAWRESAASFRARNLAIALVTNGLENGRSDEVIEGYRGLNRLPPATLNEDAAALTSLGTVLLTAKQPEEALRQFGRACELRPAYAPYQVNLAQALLALKQTDAARTHLRRALELDPLLAQAVTLLASVYKSHGDEKTAADLERSYSAAMHGR